MQHFLLIYDHERQELSTTRQFSDDECDEATSAYQAAEAEHRDDPNVEIVLIGADSIETIHRTHGHYFRREVGASKYLTAT
jgi:hypothetical protein